MKRGYRIFILILAMSVFQIISGCAREEKQTTETEPLTTLTKGSVESMSSNNGEVATENRAEEPQTTITEVGTEHPQEETAQIKEEDKRIDVDQEKIRSFVKTWSPEGDNDYYLMPDSDTRFLTEEDLSSFRKTELRLIRNEIVARHGWDFTDPVIKSYFITQKWYQPVDGENDRITFSDIEKANMELIDEMESWEEKPANINEMYRLIELETDKEYQITRFGKQDVLTIRQKEFMSVFFNSQCIDTDLKNDVHVKVLLYNGDEKSILYVSGQSYNNDLGETYELVIDGTGIRQEGFPGPRIIDNTRNAICTTYMPWLIGTPVSYEWDFISLEGKLILKGRTVLSYDFGDRNNTFKLIQSLPVYVYEGQELRETVLDEGTQVRIESVDFRSDDLEMVELICNGLHVYLPTVRGEDHFLYTKDGVSVMVYFDRSELPFL